MFGEIGGGLRMLAVLAVLCKWTGVGNREGYRQEWRSLEKNGCGLGKKRRLWLRESLIKRLFLAQTDVGLGIERRRRTVLFWMDGTL